MRPVGTLCLAWTTVMGLVLAAAVWPAGGHAQMAPTAQPTPKVGENARDFTLQSLDGATVRLSAEVSQGPIVLVVLRGWPGYQCPFCTRQFGDFRLHAAKFGELGVRVVFVYPGPNDGLKAHAEEFTATAPIPPGFRMLLDPDYTVTRMYGLRWDAPNETAYPSTFVLDKHGIITFAQTSRSHGDRVSAETVLKVLANRE